MTVCDLEHVAWQLGLDAEFTLEIVLDPRISLWGELDSGRFDELFGGLATRIDPSLLALAIISQRLLAGSGAPDWLDGWIDRRPELIELTGANSIRSLLEYCWTAVPVLVSGPADRLIYFMAGAASKPGEKCAIASTARFLLDDQGLRAILAAADAARRDLGTAIRFACWPLTNRPVGGASMGLALYLGFRSAASGRSFWPKIGASGVIGPSGSIEPVENLEQKAKCAAAKGLEALVVSRRQASIPTAGLEILEAGDLETAWLMASMFRPGKTDLLESLMMAVDTPGLLPSVLENVPPEWIIRLKESGRFQAATRLLEKDGQLLQGLTRALENSLSARRLDRAEAISQLVPLDVLDRQASLHAEKVVGWCLANLALANNLGLIEQSRRWEQVTGPYLKAACRIDPGLAALYYNLRLVSSHNRFEFKPRIDRELEKWIDRLQKQFAAERKAGKRVKTSLGGLYGSLAQNFGFCGPAWLDSTLEMCRRSLMAFGGGRVAAMEADIRRLFNYRFYALLEAGQKDRARRALLMHLGTGRLPSCPGQWVKLDCWQQAALARYMADVKRCRSRGAYLYWAWENRKFLTASHHPWQLWHFNLGRIALERGATRLAGYFFQRSLELCRQRHAGPTVQAMALLPLAGINALQPGSCAPGSLDRALEVAALLNRAHFERLLANRPGALELVWRKPQSWFPFTYH